jgi:hypothetical protein
MNRFTAFLSRLFRPKATARGEGEKVYDRKADARIDLVDGRGLGPTGDVMDFERDSRRG